MDLKEMQTLMIQLKDNVGGAIEEWTSLQQDLWLEGQTADRSGVWVQRIALDNLQAEIQMLKENLPMVINYDLLMAVGSLHKLEKDLERSNRRMDKAEKESQHWKARHNAARIEYEKERQEKLVLKGEVSQLTQRVALQSDYCAGMGAVCCTLLWRASQHEQAIPALLLGSQIQKFMSVVCHTLDSFLATYSEEDIPSEESEELQFVMAMIGIITNIAASASGRDCLARNNGCSELVHTFTTLLSMRAGRPISKLKNLILMALYNLSINNRGLTLLIKTKGIIPLLVWLLQTESSLDIRLHSLLLVQSLILDNQSTAFMDEVKECLSMDLLESMAKNTSSEIKEVTGEILQVIISLKRHEP